MTYDTESSTYADRSVTALFDSQAEAQRAVDRLVDAGIPSGRIHQTAGGSASATRTDDGDKGFWDSLGDFFFPDEDRYTYAEGLSRGGVLVTVTGLRGGEYDTALDILDDEGSVDLDEREANWRSEGWGGYESSAYATGAAGGMAAGSMAGGYDDAGMARRDMSARDTGTRGDEEVIPVVEEHLRVGKRAAAQGRVRVRAYTVEEPVSETVDLREQRVEIDRRPVDRPVSAADAFQDRTIEAEEYREEAVIQKEARVVEEIGLRKTDETRRETVSDTVRRTEVEIEEDGNRDGMAGTVRRDTDRDRI